MNSLFDILDTLRSDVFWAACALLLACVVLADRVRAYRD